jgi:hypothetical protein
VAVYNLPSQIKTKDAACAGDSGKLSIITPKKDHPWSMILQMAKIVGGLVGQEEASSGLEDDGYRAEWQIKMKDATCASNSGKFSIITPKKDHPWTMSLWVATHCWWVGGSRGG